MKKKELKLEKLSTSLEVQKNDQIKIFTTLKSSFEKEYRDAIALVKDAIKAPLIEQKHRLLNEAHAVKIDAENKTPIKTKDDNLNIGDSVKYGNLKGVILQIKKEFVLINVDGISMRVPKNSLKKYINTQNIRQKKYKEVIFQKPSVNSGVVLDLHGLRADEAIDKLDKFLSDALLSNFDEVQIYHGMGTGRLAYVVKSFLKEHPSVKSFSDAPANQGGYGATIAKL